MSAVITAIEDAMIARIRLINTAATVGALIKTIDRYSGDFSEEGVERLAMVSPFVLLSHTGSAMETSSGTGERWRGRFTVVCGAVTRRTQSMTARVGGPSAQEIGSRALAELMRDLLAGQQLGLPISPLVPVSVDEVYSGAPSGESGQHWLSITGVQFETLYSTARSTVGDGGNVTSLLAFHGIWTPVSPDGQTLPVPDNETSVVGGSIS